MKIAIIVDSTAYLNKEISEHPHVYQVKLSLVFDDGKVFEDSATLEDQKLFYDYMQKSKTLPKSSQPQPGVYYQLVEYLIEQGYQGVIALHLSAGISGTYNLAHSVLKEYEDQIESYVIDSKSSCVVLEALVRYGISLLDQGVSLKEVAQRLTWKSEHTQTYLMVEALDNLVKGGRLSSGLATLGHLLKIRPLLHFNEEGKIVLFEKIRTNRKVYLRWIDLIRESQNLFPQGVQVVMTHALALEECQRMVDLIKQEFDIDHVLVNSIGPVIGTHTGPSSLGLAIIPNDKVED